MTEWWRGGVIYQIYPRSFRDSDGDGIGDLRGIAEKLDHVAGLGVDGIWLCPFFKSPMKDFGYDVEDYRAVDPMFGTLEDFDHLLARAHDLGLRVIIDMVLSHTSDLHPWFLESRESRDNPRADWYVWADAKPDGTPPNNWLSVFGGSAWAWEPRRNQYYLHNFLTSQPDLNLHDGLVQDAVLDACRFWLDRGVDGFRLDTANFYMHDPELRDNPPRPSGSGALEGVASVNPYGMQRHVYDKSRPENLAFLRRLRALMDRYPGTMTVAEVHDDDSTMRSAEYVGSPDLLHTAYGFTLLTERFGAGVIRGALESFERQPGRGWPAWAFGNHDVIRPVTRWGKGEGGDGFAKLLVALLCSVRGTAFLYEGEELGLPEADVPYGKIQDPYGLPFYPRYKGRDGCRTPMPWRHDHPAGGFTDGTAEPWLPMPEEHLRRAVSVQDGDPGSVLNFTRGFLRWRREHPALVTGDIRFLDAPEPVIAFVRSGGGEEVLAAFNLGGEPAAIEAPGGVEALSGHGLDGTLDGGRIRLPGHGAFLGRLSGTDNNTTGG